MKNKIIIILSLLIILAAIIISVFTAGNNYSKNKSYISNDVKEKLESVDTSGETISDTNYRSLADEELEYIEQVCSEYGIDINESVVEFDITTDTYIIRAEQATVFIELSTGIVDVEYTKHINY